MSKLKYTIVQKGGAFHMTNKPINFILHCTSKSEVDNKLEMLLKNANVPKNTKIKFSGITLPTNLDLTNWTQDSNILTCAEQGTNKLHFYELIELVKKRYKKYNLRFNSSDDFDFFFKKLLPLSSPLTINESITGNIMLREYILRNIDVYIDSIKKFVPLDEWKTFINKLIHTDFEKCKEEIKSNSTNYPLDSIFLLENTKSVILLIGENHINYDKTKHVAFYNLIKNIIDNYIKKYENTNFFIEYAIHFGKVQTFNKSHHGGSHNLVILSVLSHIIYYIYINEKDIEKNICGKIHYTDIRQKANFVDPDDIIKEQNYIEHIKEIKKKDFEYLSHIQIKSNIINIIKKIINYDNFIKIFIMDKKVYEYIIFDKSENYHWSIHLFVRYIPIILEYSITNTLNENIIKVEDEQLKIVINHNTKELQGNSIPMSEIKTLFDYIFEKIFEKINKIITKIKKKNNNNYIQLQNYLSNIEMEVNLLCNTKITEITFEIIETNLRDSFNKNFIIFVCNKVPDNFFSDGWKNIVKIWNFITYTYFNLIMDIYTVNKLINYSKETPSIYFAGNFHITTCKYILEQSFKYNCKIIYKK